MGLTAGAIVPLTIQLPDENASEHIRATVLDSTNTPISGSPFTLPFITAGLYSLNTVVMPNAPFITAIYEVFNDSGFTTRSTVYGTTSETFTLEIPGTVTVSGGAQLITGSITEGSNTCFLSTKPIQITQGANATFDIRFISSLNGDPIDLTSATTVNVQLLNTDQSILTVGLTSGVSIISPPTIGKIQASLTTSQTALLQYGIVPLSVTMIIGGVTFIVQFPQAVNVLESVFS